MGQANHQILFKYSWFCLSNKFLFYFFQFLWFISFISMIATLLTFSEILERKNKMNSICKQLLEHEGKTLIGFISAGGKLINLIWILLYYPESGLSVLMSFFQFCYLVVRKRVMFRIISFSFLLRVPETDMNFLVVSDVGGKGLMEQIWSHDNLDFKPHKLIQIICITWSHWVLATKKGRSWLILGLISYTFSKGSLIILLTSQCGS